MLGQQEIQEVLRARRVVPLGVPNPHGPLGLEQVAAVIVRLDSQPPKRVGTSEAMETEVGESQQETPTDAESLSRDGPVS